MQPIRGATPTFDITYAFMLTCIRWEFLKELNGKRITSNVGLTWPNDVLQTKMK